MADTPARWRSMFEKIGWEFPEKRAGYLGGKKAEVSTDTASAVVGELEADVPREDKLEVSGEERQDTPNLSSLGTLTCDPNRHFSSPTAER